MHLHHKLAYRGVVALLLAALCLAPTLAFAAPSGDASGSGGSTVTPPPAPAAPKPSPAPQPKTSPADPGTGSAIPTPLTPEQQAFRDELAKRQARLTALQAQLDALDVELEIATEQFNAAEGQLAATKKKLEVTQKDLENAQTAYQEQLTLLEARIRVMYQGGTLDAIGLLLQSTSVSDFVRRITFLNLVGEKDATLAETLGNQRDGIQQALLDLKDAKLQAEQLEFQLKARRIEIQLRIQERQQMLASAQADLLQLLGQQSSQRQAEQAALLKQILSGAAGAGIVVQPGTPVETALAYHGIPYVWAGADPSGFDCSGLVLYVFAQHGVTLPHYSGSQFQLGMPVAPQDLQPNDVVFFGNPVHHVGIYLGNDYFIHAPRTGDFVKVSRLSDRSDFAGARRYPWVLRIGPIWGVGSTAPNPNSLLPN